MHYLYHRVPEKFLGDTLFPLNQLKDRFPELYQKQIEKYVGREYILEQRIPILHCLWNDVLHFTAVHPHEVEKALTEAGRKDSSHRSYFQIDPHVLAPKKTIVYLYAQTERTQTMEETNFTPYNPNDLEKYSHFPKETKRYYAQMIQEGKRPLLYHRVPHILYHGTLHIADCPIVIV